MAVFMMLLTIPWVSASIASSCSMEGWPRQPMNICLAYSFKMLLLRSKGRHEIEHLPVGRQLLRFSTLSTNELSRALRF
jgi:hypothetical protein